MEDLGLVNARGQPLTKSTMNTSGSFKPTSLFTASSADLKGATPNPRRFDYKLYIDMYLQHPVLKAAIDKKVMVATNTGYEFVPRSRRMKEVPEEQARIAIDFFDQQEDFLTQLRAVYLDLELFGDAFMYVVPDRRRRPKRLKHIAPWTIHIKGKKNGSVEFYVQTVGNDVKVFKPHEIIHFRHINPDDDLYGLSRLEAIKSTIISDLYAENYNLNFFKNGAATGTMFVIKNASQRELELNRTWIRDEYVGSENAHKPIILAGDVDVKHAVATHAEMGFLEGRDHNKKVILAALDVPPAKIGDMETANRSNSKEQDKSFRTEAVMPLQYIVEEGLSNFIRDVLGCPDVLFKHSEADIRDAQEQMDLWGKAAEKGFMTINEVRARMGMAEIEGGDIATVMTPTGAVPVVDLELYFKLARPNTDVIPAQLHDHDTQDDAHQNPGPVPRGRDTDNAIVTGAPPATKSRVNDELRDAIEKNRPRVPLSLTSACEFVDAAAQDEKIFNHCLTYIMDAVEEVPHPMLDEALAAFKKARRYTDDPEIRLTYIERASVLLKKYKGVLDGEPE